MHLHYITNDSLKAFTISLALKALYLITDIGTFMGRYLDSYTFDIIFSNLLRCSSQSKKIIASQIIQVTNTFLSTTPFYSKTIQLLMTAIGEKNNQLRHFASVYLKTVLETHGKNESTKAAMERTGSHDLVEQIIKKGLFDATPFVREVCRQTYWVFYSLWPPRAERIMLSLDPTTRKQLEKHRIDGIPNSSVCNSRVSMPMPPRLRVSGMPARQSRLSTISTLASPLRTSIQSPRRSTLVRQNSMPSSTSTSILSRKRPLTEPSQGTLPLRRPRTVPPADSPMVSPLPSHSLQTSSLSPLSSSSASASFELLRGLQSNDVETNCRSLRIELLPILTDYITQTTKDVQIYETLMSWESLANIFVRILSVNHYGPTYLISSKRQCV
ncbi:clasp N terminal-domain-containing protein [Phycomyces nitens]|nr:clasp N terminal-domain-containing protein [Phycomyces nitens]